MHVINKKCDFTLIYLPLCKNIFPGDPTGKSDHDLEITLRSLGHDVTQKYLCLPSKFIMNGSKILAKNVSMMVDRVVGEILRKQDYERTVDEREIKGSLHRGKNSAYID